MIPEVSKTARRRARTVKIGNVKIGGNSPIAVQSMTKTDTRDIKKKPGLRLSG